MVVPSIKSSPCDVFSNPRDQICLCDVFSNPQDKTCLCFVFSKSNDHICQCGILSFSLDQISLYDISFIPLVYIIYALIIYSDWRNLHLNTVIKLLVPITNAVLLLCVMHLLRVFCVCFTKRLYSFIEWSSNACGTSP